MREKIKEHLKIKLAERQRGDIGLNQIKRIILKTKRAQC